ncbi:MAG TPA: DNA-binding protein [Candidatus Elarobacter sp.]|jgi:hypothetical protein
MAVGRPGLKYDDVADAANELVTNGTRPTLRAVRAALGRGSPTVIGRHLTTWEARRVRAKAQTPFAVHPQDVEDLPPADFAVLLNHLARTEARREGVPTSPDTTQRINDPDGGVDGMLQWTEGPSRTLHFPARTVVWQTKSGRRLSPSELVREIETRDGRGLKPRIRQVLEAGGAYVIFCAADMTVDQKLTRLTAINDVVRRHLNGVEGLITIVSGDEIATWAAQDLWARTYLIRAAGREQSPLFLTFDEWSRLPGLDNDYIWTDAATDIANDLRHTVTEGTSVYRVDGAPGLGKTRLALEALRPLNAQGNGVIYFNAGRATTELELLRALPNWRRLGVSGILVVDDCDLDLHQKVAGAIAGTAMSAVTIDYRQQSGASATLSPSSGETIEQIVRAHSARLHPYDIPRVVQYAQGWPLMAILMITAVLKAKAQITDLDDDELTRRLLDAPEDSIAFSVLQVLSLFDHVGFRDDVEPEWETLRVNLLPNVSREAFHRAVRTFERKGLVASIGRYWRVTPPPLAIRLTRRWLEDAPPEYRERLFTELPPALMNSLARRFGDVSTQTAIDLAAKLVAAGERFGELGGIVGDANLELFRSLAEVNPGAAIATLTRVFSALTDKQIYEIDESEGRQILVWTLEGIAFHRDHFKPAARLLYALARNENSHYGNNASGTFTKLFRILGSQTEAHPSERMAILDEMLLRRDKGTIQLVAKALGNILTIHSGYVALGPESQGGRPKLVEWRPTTWEEVFDYYGAAVDRVLKLSKASPLGLTLARNIFADGIPALVRYRRWGDLRRGIGRLRNGAWPLAVERLNWSLRHDLKDAEEDARTTAADLLRSLIPSELRERVRLFVSEPPHGLEERNGKIVDDSIENIDRFAKETIASNDVRAVLDIISTGTHRLPHAYGQSIARHIEDRVSLAEEALDAYSKAAEPRSELALMSIVGTLGESDSNLRSTILDRIAADPKLIEALPAVSMWPRVEPQDVKRLISAYSSGKLALPPQRQFFMSSAYALVPDNLLRRLARTFLDRGWYSTVVALLLFGPERSDRFDDIFAETVLKSDFIHQRMEDLYEWSLMEAIRRIVDAGDTAFGLAVARQMMDLSLSGASFGAKRRVAGLWPALLCHDEVWTELVRRYEMLARHGRWKLLIGTQYMPEGTAEHKLALEVVPLDDLMAFASKYPAEVPSFLAQNATMVETDSEDRLTVTPLMATLLERFGDDENVLRSLTAMMHSFLSVGPRAIYYAKRIALLDDIPTFQNAKIGAWKEYLRADLEKERQEAQAHDDEFESGIF